MRGGSSGATGAQIRPRRSRRFRRDGMSDWYCDEILTGRTEVDKVHETEDVLAFKHTRPSYTTHVVVIPKRHVPSFADLGSADEALLFEVIRVARTVASEMLDGQGACRVITNLGHYQDSKHLHFHVVSGERLAE